jgi:hypothetical protein
MTRRLLAYLAYAVGSVVFLGVALSKGSLMIAAGSALFLLGTLLLLVPQAVMLTRSRASRSEGHRR